MKRRASALVYVIIVVFSITSVVLVGAKMASASDREFQYAYRSAQFKFMSDGVVAETIADCYKETMATGSRSSAFTGISLTSTVIDHPTLTRAYKLAITGTIADRVFSTTRVIGQRKKPHPTFYAIWCNDNYGDSLLATAVNGSAYFNQDATFTGAWNVSDDLLVNGAPNIVLTPTVSGSYLTNVRDQTLPNIQPTDYAAQSTATVANWAGITFAGLDAQGKYPVLYRDGNLNLNGGVLSGKGTVVVKGNLVINGNYNYQDANSRVLFVVEGNVTVNLLATSIAGTFLTKSDVRVNALTLNVIRGNLCGKKVERSLAAITVAQEMGFLEDPTACVMHRMPGYFP